MHMIIFLKIQVKDIVSKGVQLITHIFKYNMVKTQTLT